LAKEFVAESFSDTFAFIVAASNANVVDVSPVFFDLRVNLGVTIDLRRRGDKEAGLDAVGEVEHVQGTDDGRLNGLDAVVLVENGGGGAS